MNTKNEIREQAAFHRDRIKPEDEDIENASMLFLQECPDLQNRVVAGYWPLGKEFDVRYLMQDALEAGAKLALPIASKDSRVMSFAPWDGKTDLIKGAFGIMVPDTDSRVDPDILLIPFLAFDRKGYRLGRGAGHYDNTIADLRARRDVLAIGVGYAGQAVLFNLPVEPHDEKLDIVITPNGVHDFRK